MAVRYGVNVVPFAPRLIQPEQPEEPGHRAGIFRARSTDATLPKRVPNGWDCAFSLIARVIGAVVIAGFIVRARRIDFLFLIEVEKDPAPVAIKFSTGMYRTP